MVRILGMATVWVVLSAVAMTKSSVDKAVERNETQLAAEQIFDEQEIKVYLPDSTFCVLRIDAETTAADVAHATAEKVGLANLLDHFALIELMNTTDTRVLHSGEKVQVSTCR